MNTRIQISSWQGVCQRIAEHEKVTLVITGLSSKLSADDIATEFRGRSQAHLVGLLREFSMSIAPSSTVPNKVYAIDQGMAFATARASQQDIEKRLETAVYMELMRRTANGRMETVTSYTARTSSKKKVDFLVDDALATKPYELLQVTVDMTSEKTRRREVGSLEIAIEETHVARGDHHSSGRRSSYRHAW